VYIYIYVRTYVLYIFGRCRQTYRFGCGEPAISLDSHHVSLVQWTTRLLPVTRDPGSKPIGGLMWNRDSPVSVVLLHWWPRRDWSILWPRLRWASSWTITRPSCRQCDNPTWSHTAHLSQFHTRCRSSFRLHNRRSRLLGGEPCGEPAISLHSHHVSLVQWTTCLLPLTRDPASKPMGGLMWNRDSPVSVVLLHGNFCGIFQHL
jgi:hypothetical protein